MTILILGGTTEAADLARRLAAHRPIPAAIVSLAGRVSRPAPSPLPLRIGGFGGVDGLTDFIIRDGITVLVDATHPFARAMPFNAAAACAAAGIPCLALRRPPWRQESGDEWRQVPTVEAAAAALGDTPLRVFLAIGRQELAPFAGAPQHHYVVRSIDPVPDRTLLAHATYTEARGPFDVEAEVSLLRRQAIDVVVAKNGGGEATYGKIVAARRLRLPVLMVARPPKPPAVEVASVEEALGWLADHNCLP